MINILICEGQKILRESLKYFIENKGAMKVVGVAADGAEAYEHCRQSQPDLILFDISMSKYNGVEVIKLVKSQFPNIKILLLTNTNNDVGARRALLYGADGYVTKNIGIEELLLAIKCIKSGMTITPQNAFNSNLGANTAVVKCDNSQVRPVKIGDIDVYLTHKELAIIQLIVNGKNNKEIASTLFMAEGTIKNAITLINSKLQLKDRTQLAVFAIRNNLA